MLSRGTLSRSALLLVKLGNEIMARAEDPLAAIGLSGRQYIVLAVLSEDAPPSQQELAGLCGLLPAQIVPVIDELERRGMVARQRSETDRRRSVVTLTEAGTEALRQADALGDRLVADLDEGVRQAAVDALARSYNTAG
ncbi:MarR family transcriptional regulator [Solirubrobacter sp. CPCC 204708]|uniref:MarR family transcriptional regulator n=1 Tax=Solirubrobacter deserti TaxID=2282478 RepID=A0ABT4RL90_9ACTN|nr:MarR family transcriptional regulator [Solirubrobacter deserti]MBE2317331.1 MarR family transcriptional regulator [Solirubrobacter deserti]MDA0139060.1 MarR family transcriptional regulator [Solirubrobacter deserti]